MDLGLPLTFSLLQFLWWEFEIEILSKRQTDFKSALWVLIHALIIFLKYYFILWKFRLNGPYWSFIMHPWKTWIIKLEADHSLKRWLLRVDIVLMTHHNHHHHLAFSLSPSHILNFWKIFSNSSFQRITFTSSVS